MALPLTVTGIAIAGGVVGPYRASHGAYYFVGRGSTSGTYNQLVVRKTSDPSVSWDTSPVANLTVANTNGVVVTGTIIDGVRDGDKIHLVTSFQNSTTALYRVHYHVFDMATDAWTLSNDPVDGPTDILGTTNWISATIVRRAASTVIGHNMAQVTNVSKYTRIGYRERPDATGLWSAVTALDALGTGPTNAYQLRAVKDPQSDRIHFIWYEGTASLRTRTLSAANALSATTTTTLGTAHNTAAPVIPYTPVAYVAGGVSKVVFSQVGNTTLIQATLRFDSADDPVVATSTATLSAAAGSGTWRLFVDDQTVWALWVDTATGDMFRRSSTDHGATWGSTTVAFASTFSSNALGSTDGRIYPRGGNLVVPFIGVSTTTLYYFESITRAEPPPSSTQVKHAGTWKPATTYVKHAGTWKAATPYVKQGGVWKQA